MFGAFPSLLSPQFTKVAPGAPGWLIVSLLLSGSTGILVRVHRYHDCLGLNDRTQFCWGEEAKAVQGQVGLVWPGHILIEHLCGLLLLSVSPVDGQGAQNVQRLAGVCQRQCVRAPPDAASQRAQRD